MEKREFMRTQPLFKKLLRIEITTVLYILVIIAVYHLLKSLFHITHPAIALFITLSTLIFYHEQISLKIRYFIDKNLYHNIYRINKLADNFNFTLSSTLDFQEIVARFIQFLQEAFGVHQWAFYYCWGEDYELFASNKITQDIPKLVKLPETTRLDELLKNGADFYPLHKLAEWQSDLSTALKPFQSIESAYYFIPLRSYKGYLGFMIFDRELTYYLHFQSLNRLIKDIVKKTADVFQNDFLYSEVRKKSLQNSLLLQVGKKISATLDLLEVLETIIDSVNQLVKYDAGGIFLIDDSKKQLDRMITRGYDTKVLDKLVLKLDLGIYGWVIKNKKPSIINEVKNNPDYYSVRESTNSQLTVPLSNGEDVLGVMALESDQLNHFTPADRELLMTFASQAVIAIENAQLFEESLQRKRLESELVVASKVQKALLPERPPEIAGLKITFFSVPSQIVGGDFYDIFKLGPKKLAIAIGDVSGKGAPASILMAMLYAGFRSLLKVIYPVVEVVARLNNLITDTTAEGYFATFFFGIYNHETRELTYSNAGHNPPILLRRDESFERLEKGGIVLGFLKNQEYHQEQVTLQSGDSLILYTDGISEVINSEGDEYGEERLIEFIKKNRRINYSEIKRLLMEELNKFSAQQEMADDATFALIRVE
jgi:sigma-B regulation protein RsbU (phosphoserine phosphatase)